MQNSGIYCPREQSSMTPCIARDGWLALADNDVCVGCGWHPSDAVRDLGGRYDPAGAKGKDKGSPKVVADRFHDLVVAYIELKNEA